MKKIKYIVILVLLSFVIVACGNNSDNIKNISYKEFKEMKENKETFMVEVIQNGCEWCKAFAPKFKEVLEENNVISYKLNRSNMSESELKELTQEFNEFGTPTVIFITNGEEQSSQQRISGNVSKQTIIDKLTDNGYIKEKK